VSRSAIRKGGEEAFIIDLSGTLDKGILQELRGRSSGVTGVAEFLNHLACLQNPKGSLE
jgi:hypothetical protein